MRVDFRRAVRWRLRARRAVGLSGWVIALLLLMGTRVLAQTQADRLYLSYGLSGGGSLDAGGVHVKAKSPAP